DTDGARERNEQIAHNEQTTGAAGFIEAVNPANQLAAPAIDHLASDQVGLVEFTRVEWSALACRDAHFRAAQTFSVGNGIDAGKLEDQGVTMEPSRFHSITLTGSEQEHFLERFEPLRLAAQRQRGNFATIAPRPAQQSNRDPTAFL